MNRRAFLVGLGGGLGLTALPRFGYGDDERKRPTPRRLVIITQNNGTQQGAFWPAPGTFTSPILAPLLAHSRIAQRTLLVRGIHLVWDANGTDANEHDMGFIRMWTGAKLHAVAGHPWGGAPSVDQLVARESGAASLTLGVHTSAIEPHPKPSFQHRRSFSYVAKGVHKLPTLDPFQAYTRLFWGGEGLNPETRRRLTLRKSALDASAAALRDMKGRLGPAEAARLDAHAESIRALETQLSDVLAGRRGPGATCSRRPPPPRDYHSTGLELLVNDEAAIPEMVRSHLDLIVAALACDVTRVATLQLGYCGGRWKFDWLGIGESHHELAHLDTADAGGDNAAVTASLVKLNRWTAEQVAYLAQKLDAIPEGRGTVLDHTLIVWSNEFGRGDHNMENIPVVFVGGPMPAGGRVVDAGRQPFQRVGCTVLNAMGLPAAGFGDAPDCGPLLGL
ncbi:MAG TPA: DUF1552 domain-containing protein [Kofleriaceae bacterium]|nr:DUF1552 domain-containing protein [Kofleriaceae bacterium]